MKKHLVIRHHRPHYPIVIGILLSVSVVIGGWWLFDYGLSQAGFERERLAEKEGAWLQTKTQLEQEIDKQVAQATRLEQGYQVEQVAYKKLQKEIVKLHDEVSNLKDELTFYRDIVDPVSYKKGLLIRGLIFSRLEKKGHYHYKIVITKAPNDGNWVSGSLTFEVEGNEKSELKRYNLQQISLSRRPARRISFRFKYFQNLTGDIRLPDGFEPTKVTLTLNPRGKKFKKSVEPFDWIVEEN